MGPFFLPAKDISKAAGTASGAAVSWNGCHVTDESLGCCDCEVAGGGRRSRCGDGAGGGEPGWLPNKGLRCVLGEAPGRTVAASVTKPAGPRDRGGESGAGRCASWGACTAGGCSGSSPCTLRERLKVSSGARGYSDKDRLNRVHLEVRRLGGADTGQC